VGRPRQGLDSGLMVRETETWEPIATMPMRPRDSTSYRWSRRVSLSDPGKSAYFLGVSIKGGRLCRDANVVVDNESVATTTREQVSVPSEGANPIGMAVHGTKLLAPCTSQSC
jgi:hypothetical protein